MKVQGLIGTVGFFFHVLTLTVRYQNIVNQPMESVCEIVLQGRPFCLKKSTLNLTVYFLYFGIGPLFDPSPEIRKYKGYDSQTQNAHLEHMSRQVSLRCLKMRQHFPRNNFKQVVILDPPFWISRLLPEKDNKGSNSAKIQYHGQYAIFCMKMQLALSLTKGITCILNL